MRVRVLS
jgi:hypothetical protein